MNLWYFATPYSHPDPAVVESRYLQALVMEVELINRGYMLLAPIAASHQQAQRFNLPGDFEFWQERDRLFIDRCDGVIIGDIPGWRESKGVTAEIAHATAQKKPVYLYSNQELKPLAQVFT